jgi:anaerobic magnesium-protoporphyrin IX monomethyl ester cyclase
MKILFVYPDINVRGGAQSYQFGIGMVSAFLKTHGHETKLHYMYNECSIESLLKEISDWKPDILAFSAVSPQFQYVYDVIKSLPAERPFTLLGGQHATLCPSYMR